MERLITWRDKQEIHRLFLLESVENEQDLCGDLCWSKCFDENCLQSTMNNSKFFNCKRL